MTDAHIVVMHSESGLRPEVRESWARLPYDVEYALTTVRSDFSYAEELRRVWRYPECDLVVCEQDVCPPEGSPASLLACPEPWCTHPHWVGSHHLDDALGLVKFSAGLRRNFPALMDLVCTEPDPRYWVRRGWTRLDRACSAATLNSSGRRAALVKHAMQFHRCCPADDWITTHDWMGLDTDLSKALRQAGLTPHVHQPPTIHLHDYSAAPKDGHVPWYLREYAERDWPE